MAWITFLASCNYAALDLVALTFKNEKVRGGGETTIAKFSQNTVFGLLYRTSVVTSGKLGQPGPVRVSLNCLVRIPGSARTTGSIQTKPAAWTHPAVQSILQYMAAAAGFRLKQQFQSCCFNFLLLRERSLAEPNCKDNLSKIANYVQNALKIIAASSQSVAQISFLINSVEFSRKYFFKVFFLLGDVLTFFEFVPRNRFLGRKTQMLHW